jgi:putative transposase
VTKANRTTRRQAHSPKLLEYKCEREGTHFVAVDPKDTTKKCASCGDKSDKPLWVREYSCPSCGFEADRDANVAWNVLSRSRKDVGVGHSEAIPVETALLVDTVVSAKRVVETGSPTLKERTASVVSE